MPTTNDHETGGSTWTSDHNTLTRRRHQLAASRGDHTQGDVIEEGKGEDVGNSSQDDETVTSAIPDILIHFDDLFSADDLEPGDDISKIQRLSTERSDGRQLDTHSCLPSPLTDMSSTSRPGSGCSSPAAQSSSTDPSSDSEGDHPDQSQGTAMIQVYIAPGTVD